MKKKCPTCKKNKNLNDFNKSSRTKSGLAHVCKLCARASNKAWYTTNWERKIEQQKQRRHELRDYVDSLKTLCLCCSEREPCCLEWHHVETTSKDIDPANMVGRGWSKNRIDREIAKCVQVCSNCHKKIHKGILRLPS